MPEKNEVVGQVWRACFDLYCLVLHSPAIATTTIAVTTTIAPAVPTAAQLAHLRPINFIAQLPCSFHHDAMLPSSPRQHLPAKCGFLAARRQLLGRFSTEPGATDLQGGHLGS